MSDQYFIPSYQCGAARANVCRMKNGVVVEIAMFGADVLPRVRVSVARGANW